jgi:hypothetical protein
MNYNNTLYTHPIAFAAGSILEIEPPVGDSYLITLKECNAPALVYSPSRGAIERSKVIRNTLFVSEEYHGIASVAKEGESITITVKASAPVATDTTVNWVISHGGVFSNGELSNHKPNIGSFDYTTLHKNTVDADFDVLGGTATILAGTDSVDVVINSVDDTVWTGGVNTFKIATFTISDPSDTMMLMQRNSAVILLEDNTPTPVYEGDVELWVRMGDHEDCHLEPLGGRSDPVKFSIGYDTEGNSLLETCIFDDTNIKSIAFKTSTDATAPNGEDITGGVLYYKAQIKSGRRNVN